jgi:hypothetical protein
VAVFALQEVEQLDQVALLGVRAALAVGLVVVAEVPVDVGADVASSYGRPSRLVTVRR